MQKTLITAWEVVKYSPAREDYPPTKVCEHILDREITLFRECLGTEFYNIMKNDLKQYHQYPVYDSTEIYNSGDIVTLDGCLIESLVDENTENPILSDSWQGVKKFNTQCYQTLWELYLRKYLAFMILADSIIFTTLSASSKGLLTSIEDNTSGQLRMALTEFRKQLQNLSANTLDNMKEYIIANKTSCEFSKAKICQSGCNTDKIRRGRIAFLR